MKAIRRPLFLVDVEEAVDYLFTQADEKTALRWCDKLKRTLNLIREFPEIGRLRFDLPINDIRTFQLKNFPNWFVFYRGRPDRIPARQTRHDAFARLV